MAKLSKDERMELRLMAARQAYAKVTKQRSGFQGTRVITVGVQKGGVGKTTMTENLGIALASQQRRVLLIDLDPQGSLTIGLGMDESPTFDDEKTMREVLLGEIALPDVLLEVKPNLLLAPSIITLARVEEWITPRRRTLFKMLRDYLDLFDYVLIDTPPGLGGFVYNSLAASTEVLIPWIQSDPYVTRAIPEFLVSILEIQEDYPDAARLNGVVSTKAVPLRKDIPATKAARINTLDMEMLFGEEIFLNTAIPENTTLNEGVFMGKSIIDYDPKSPAAQAYVQLAKEIIAQEVN